MPFPSQQPLAYTKVAVETLNPGQTGCYGIFRDRGPWVYVGRADDIRRRLLEHLNGDNPCITRAQPTHFVTEITSDPVRRERELIQELQPSCNQRVG